MHVAPDDLLRFCQAALVAGGASAAAAGETARGLLFADLHGIDDLGVADLEDGYLRGLAEGLVDGRAAPEVTVDRAGIGLVDARGGLGHPAAALAMDLAVRKAQRCGIGAVGVFNSARCGAMSYYTHRAATRGAVSLALTNRGGCPTGPDGRRPPLDGTSQLAMAAPGGGFPPFGLQLGALYLSGERLDRETAGKRPGAPQATGAANWRTAVSREQTPGLTAFPVRHEDLPVSGPHGHGLSLMIDILCGVLTGAAVGFDRAAPGTGGTGNVGHFFVALEVGMFRDPLGVAATMDDMLGELATGVAVAGPPPGYPGLRSGAVARERSASGIPIGRPLLDRLNRVARRCGLEPLCANALQPQT